MRRIQGSLFAVMTLFILSIGFHGAQAQNLQCKYTLAIEQGFLSQHIKQVGRDETLHNRVVDQYVKRLDPAKIYLLQSDVDFIRTRMKAVVEKTRDRDCLALNAAQARLEERVKERAAFVKKFLDKSYKFDKSVELTLDPESKAIPKTKEEAEDFLKKYVHFQVSNYLATDLKLSEAKSNVIKSWDRILRRMKEQKEDDIYSSYLDSFARALDPHSSFLSKEVLEDFEIQMRLSLEGIGATLSQDDGFTVVEALVAGGSAARDGRIQPKDRIIAVAQGEKGKSENVVEMDLRDVVRLIRGPKGTKVKLTILRKQSDGKTRFDVVLTRDKIQLEDEAASISYLEKGDGDLKRKIGIINLPAFYADSKRGGRSAAGDMKKLLVEARTKRVDGIILDLSQNGGGSLEDAVKIAGLFFQTGTVVKQSSRDEGRGEYVLRDTDSAVDWAGPLVVLTSRVSASASEIVAGTLQDYKRAVVVGNDHTFGKGSVQSVMPIPQDLGAIKVTVGMFFTPGGNSTQHRGVDSDVVIPGPYVTDDMGEKGLDYSLPPKTIPAFLSQEANPKDGANRWTVISAELIKSLREKSKERVGANQEFKKIEEELAKSKAKGKVIKLAEVLKDKEAQDKKEKARAQKNLSKEEKEKEYLKRADIVEATDVLMDLMNLVGSRPVASGR